MTRKVGVRFNEKTYQHLLYLVENTNNQSVGELVRRIVVKDKILFFAVDTTMRGPMIDLAGIREDRFAPAGTIDFDEGQETLQTRFHCHASSPS